MKDARFRGRWSRPSPRPDPWEGEGNGSGVEEFNGLKGEEGVEAAGIPAAARRDRAKFARPYRDEAPPTSGDATLSCRLRSTLR